MQFHSEPLEEHPEVPLADEGRGEQLIDFWSRWRPSEAPLRPGQNACYVVSVGPWRSAAEQSAQMKEIVALVGAQGARVVGCEAHPLPRTDPGTLLGRGFCESVAERAVTAGADLLVIDAELSPSQMRNLEDMTGLSVSDREAVILNVFSQHAQTRNARIQVEIAQLEYLRPRIRGLGLEMDQQMGGGINGRGPGETASELRARQLDHRLAQLRREVRRLTHSAGMQRQARNACERVVLVGYTNAGKTSLMNALTDSQLSARDVPFETLDTTSRCLTRHGAEVVLSDTVGFIRRLPERLVASFESTLTEMSEASLVVVVVDAFDPEIRMHLQTTAEILKRLKAQDIPRLIVFNKVDSGTHLPPLRALAAGHEYLTVSSFDAGSVAALKARLIGRARGETRLEVFVPYEATAAMSSIYAGFVVVEAEPDESGMRFVLEGSPAALQRIERDLEVVHGVSKEG